MNDQQIVITRVFDAPRDLVWKTWTEPARVAQWLAPNGFTVPSTSIDLRPGGRMLHCMRSPEGQDIWSGGVYREVVAPERLVSTDFFADDAGHPVSPTKYGMSAEWPMEAVITVTFAEHAGTTTVTLHHAVGSAPDTERDQCQQGWNECLDRLAGYVAKA